MKEEMLNYLRQPCFKRLFALTKNKIQSLNGLRGTVVLDNLTTEEQDLIGGFLGKNCLGLTKVKISLAELDELLKNSPLETGLHAFLEVYWKEKIVTNQEKTQHAKRLWLQFFEQLREKAQTPVSRDWLDRLFQGSGNGYRTLLALYRQNCKKAANDASITVKALDYLAGHRGQSIRIPVFATLLTGDPHALDSDNAIGRLLFHGLLHYLDIPETDYTAEGKRALFREAGLLDDDISSSVAVAGLQVRPEDLRFAVFDCANAAASPLILPLRFLETKTLWQPGRNIYVVENPAVFSTFLDTCPAASLPPLVCGSGQPSVAALTLFDQLVEAGCTIYYSGDFDVKGLEIATRLAQRYHINFRAWCYDSETYLSVASGKRIPAKEINSLLKLAVPWDEHLTARMVERKLYVYQEAFIGKLLSVTKEGSFIKAFPYRDTEPDK
ncbi:TIGR02679 family protein [Desulfoscipio gibsoniae]|uniref:TIGR02679 family protein n=1 Tax=Desulfoscipio gibsoniae DSM 7213 TaxID=767817 RepID=R4KFU4_9FIRM|nr:TIGR02679 family protein [Desulfoscipio gibsoniae]AGL00507.1 TIGR02679 family protein [Desulfoscipio gibsoniae DSM 7213]